MDYKYSTIISWIVLRQYETADCDIGIFTIIIEER